GSWRPHRIKGIARLGFITFHRANARWNSGRRPRHRIGRCKKRSVACGKHHRAYERASSEEPRNLSQESVSKGARATAPSVKTRLVFPRTPAETTDIVASAVALLRKGECVALPTETVYGLAADALNAEDRKSTRLNSS